MMKKGLIVNADLCIGCRMCAITCPDAAIEVHSHGTMYVLFEY